MAPWPLTQTKAIHKAVASGDVTRLKRLLASKGTNVNTKNASGATALHIAVCGQDREAVEALLARDDIDPNAQDLNGRTALHVAVSIPVLFAIEALLGHKRIDVNLPDIDGRSPLHYAVDASMVEPKKNPAVALLLKKPEINLEARDQRQRTPLSWALHLGLADTAKALIRNRDFVPEAALRDDDGNTALHKAVRCPGTISPLVRGQSRAVLDAKNNMSETALHVAARFNALDCIEPLVKAGAGLDVRRDQDGSTPFHIAIHHSSYEFVNQFTSRWCLDLPLNVSILAKDNNGDTPLHLAAARGHEKTVENILSLYPIILSNGKEAPDPVQVAQANNKGEAAADLAASHGHVAVTILLLQSGSIESEAARSRRCEAALKILPKLFSTSTTVGMYTHQQRVSDLHDWSARDGALDVLKALRPHAGSSPSYYLMDTAAAAGQLSVVQYLVEEGVDPNLSGTWVDAPLATAASHGHVQLMRYLLSLDQVDLNRGKSNGETPLMSAIRARSEAAVSLLLSEELLRNSRIDLNLGISGSKETGQWESNPLLLTCTLGYDDMAKMLVRPDYLEQKWLTLDVRDKDGNGPLSLACKAGHLGVAKVLFGARSWRSGLDGPLFELKGCAGRSPFSYACSLPSTETVELFLKSDLMIKGGPVNPDSTDRVGMTALAYACKEGRAKTVKLILDSYLLKDGLVNPDSTDINGLTPLAHACKESQLEIVDMLLNGGLVKQGLINPDLADNNGMTPLAHACKEGRLKIVDMLLNGGLVKQGLINPGLADNNGMTPLAHACKEGRLKIVDMLLNGGLVKQGLVNPDLADNNGMTPLAHACNEKRVDIVRLILDSYLLKERRINPDARDNQGRSPLAHACSRGLWRIVRLFLDYFLSDDPRGVVDFGIVDKSGKTLVDLADLALGEDHTWTMLALLDNRLTDKGLVSVGSASYYMSERAQRSYDPSWEKDIKTCKMWPVMRRLAELRHPVRVTPTYRDDVLFWCGVNPDK
jgi:ankyrin repeat protein